LLNGVSPKPLTCEGAVSVMVISVWLCAWALPSVSSATALAMWLARNVERPHHRRENGEKNAMTFFLQRNGMSADWEPGVPGRGAPFF